MPKRDPQAPRRLPPHQRRFVDEYLVDLNATQAAIRAGYSEHTAGSQGQRLLKNVEIQAAITRRSLDRARRTEVTADSVLKKVAEMAFVNLDAFVMWEGGKIALRPSDEIPPEHMSALQEIAETPQGLRIKMADRMPALTLLFRHLRLLPLPGSREDPFHHNVTTKEADLDLSKLSDEELRQLQDLIGAVVAAQELTTRSPQ